MYGIVNEGRRVLFQQSVGSMLLLLLPPAATVDLCAVSLLACRRAVIELTLANLYFLQLPVEEKR
jgi:hypothetical protein